MLRVPEQPSGGEGGGNKSIVKVEAVPVALLLAFIRALISEVVSGDMIYLALMRAQSEMHATDAQMKELKLAVMREYATNRIWPEGF